MFGAILHLLMCWNMLLRATIPPLAKTLDLPYIRGYRRGSTSLCVCRGVLDRGSRVAVSEENDDFKTKSSSLMTVRVSSSTTRSDLETTTPVL